MPDDDSMTMDSDIDGCPHEILISDPKWNDVTTDDQLVRFVDAGLAAALPTVLSGRIAALSIELANDARVAALNRRFRGKPGPTNVLSFPAHEAHRLDEALEDAPPGMPIALGDIILAYETVEREARAQGKSVADHLAHLVIHGLLHCLGHDHQDDDEAEAMEALEIRILAGLGVKDPYSRAEESS